MFCKATSARKEQIFYAAILDHFLTKMFNSETSSFQHFSPRIPNLKNFWTSDFGKWGLNRPQNVPHEKGHQTDTQTHRQTHGHRNCLIESAQWADSMKIVMFIFIRQYIFFIFSFFLFLKGRIFPHIRETPNLLTNVHWSTNNN